MHDKTVIYITKLREDMRTVKLSTYCIYFALSGMKMLIRKISCIANYSVLAGLWKVDSENVKLYFVSVHAGLYHIYSTTMYTRTTMVSLHINKFHLNNIRKESSSM